jgi:O-antigen ligase
MQAPAVPNRLKPELRHPAEFAWLIALVFFLPLFEAPKNLCWLGYVLAWLYNRLRERDWGGPWDRWDSLIALWIASGYLVAVFAGIHHDEWSAANDILRYGSVLWLVKRSRYDERAMLWILVTIIASTLVTFAWDCWRFYIVKSITSLGLNSVGHVNHSAIYLAIVFGAALSLMFAYWGRMRIAFKALSAFACASLIVSVFVTESRAAVGAAVLFVIVLFGVLAVRGHARVLKGGLAAFLGIAIVFAAIPGVLNKTVMNSEEGLAFSYRDKIWMNGLVQWRRFPLFGVGMGNFNRAGLEQLQDWSKSQDWPVRPSAEGMHAHGHSLYVTALAERGLVGFGILIAVLVAWAVALFRAVPRAQDPPLDWTLFGAALAGWLVTVAAGVFNTTLHHEHAILSVLLLGLWLSHRAALVSVVQPHP